MVRLTALQAAYRVGATLSLTYQDVEGEETA
jgi:hypothetical protein